MSQATIQAIAELYRVAGLAMPAEEQRVVLLNELLGGYNLTCIELTGLTSEAASYLLMRRGAILEPLRNANQDALAGYIYVSRTNGHIFVERNDLIVRRRFSVAHELGHYVLHFYPLISAEVRNNQYEAFEITEGLAPFTSDDDADGLPVGRGVHADLPIQLPPYAQMENEANRFAAELLMPAQCVQYLFTRYAAECRGDDLIWRLATPGIVVERTQIITCHCVIAGTLYVYYAIVNEVYRQSRKRSMGSEIDEANGNINYQPPFENDGFTYAAASILRSTVFTPPMERSPVYLASTQEAGAAYGADEVVNGLEIGLIKNGANQIAGPGKIDLDYLLGTNGGHMKVNGSAGRGTKSSFLLSTIWLLLDKAKKEAKARPSASDRLRVMPVILNVKGFDLFYIDRQNKHYNAGRHLADWQALGIESPRPFENVTFYAPQMPSQS